MNSENSPFARRVRAKLKSLRRTIWHRAFNHVTKLSWKSCVWITVANFFFLTPMTLIWHFGAGQSLFMMHNPVFARLVLGACICGTMLTIAVCYLWRWVLLNAGPASSRSRSLVLGFGGTYILFGIFAWLGQVMSTELMAMLPLFELYPSWSYIILEPWANSTRIATATGSTMTLNMLVFDFDYLLGAAVLLVLL